MTKRCRGQALCLALIATLVLVACAVDEDPPVAADAPEDPDDTATEDDAEDDEIAEDEVADVEHPEDGLLFGYVLPETGPLSYLGPGTVAAAEMAVRDINDAGGVLGGEADLTGGDSATNPDVANTTVDRLLADGVHAIIGPIASGVALSFIDKVTRSRVVHCSPGSTSPTFTTYDDDGYFFRTVSSDVLKGIALGEAIVSQGFTRVTIMTRADDYGRAFADATVDALEERGATVDEVIAFDPQAPTFDAEIRQLGATAPEAVAIISFDEGISILQGLIEQGLGPDDIGWFAADGLRRVDLPELVDPGDPNVVDGLTGVLPAADEGEAAIGFFERLDEFRPDLANLQFTAETYDCMMLIALAAIAADSTDPSVFVDEIIDLTKDGTPCTSFGDCAELLEAGEDIDYQGASGPLEFSDVGEPDRGSYEIWTIEDGGYVTLDIVDLSL